ncbi:MAG: ATP-binding cassette domain-containing protein, partial [Candidatus Omnitrophica bacterium]|nr:ATP-binding cassette domain-containing protein [Candidatus Omnitrophota bacterium]
ENLHVEISGKKILTGVNFSIEKGQTSVMFGQNGSGKTSLVMAIMGFPQYKITKGKIIFKGKVINKLSIDQRARLGISILLQRPPTVRGVKMRQMVELISHIAKKKIDIEKMADKLNMKDFLDRDLNLGFSGGEMKRSEFLQLTTQSPDLLLLDEPESGVDLENIVLIGEVISKLLGKDKSALIITHTGHILNYVNANRGCVLSNKKIQCVGDPHDILSRIRKHGYQECVRCHRKKPEVIKEG